MSQYLKVTLLLNLFEIMSCIAGVFFWYKLKNTYWKWFVIYLSMISFTEITAEYVGNKLFNSELNQSIYIFFGIPLQFIFFFWLFYKRFEKSNAKKWPLIGAAIYGLSVLLEVIYFSDQKLWFSSFSYLTGNIVLLLLVLFFMFSFINSDEILNYRRSMMFWVCVGLLVFYLGSLPFYGLWNTMANKYPTIFNVYWFVQMGLDCLMYTFFSIAIIWGNPKS